MGRSKPGKPRREKPAYAVYEYEGESWPVSLPPPLLDLPKTMEPDVVDLIRRLKARGQAHPRVLALVSHRS